MLKKYVVFSWSSEAKLAFKEVKRAITKALVLKNLDMSKYFIMYAYGVDRSIATILAQKYDNKEEHSFAFHSQTCINTSKGTHLLKRKYYP